MQGKGKKKEKCKQTQTSSSLSSKGKSLATLSPRARERIPVTGNIASSNEITGMAPYTIPHDIADIRRQMLEAEMNAGLKNDYQEVRFSKNEQASLEEKLQSLQLQADTPPKSTGTDYEKASDIKDQIIMLEKSAANKNKKLREKNGSLQISVDALLAQIQEVELAQKTETSQKSQQQQERKDVERGFSATADAASQQSFQVQGFDFKHDPMKQYNGAFNQVRVAKVFDGKVSTDFTSKGASLASVSGKLTVDDEDCDHFDETGLEDDDLDEINLTDNVPQSVNRPERVSIIDGEDFAAGWADGGLETADDEDQDVVGGEDADAGKDGGGKIGGEKEYVGASGSRETSDGKASNDRKSWMSWWKFGQS